MINVGQKAEICSCGSSCEPIEKKQPAKQSGNKDNTKNKVCNPFQICKCCVGFNADFTFQNFTPILFFATLQTINKEKVPLHIALDFWQPPKIA